MAKSHKKESVEIINEYESIMFLLATSRVFFRFFERSLIQSMNVYANLFNIYLEFPFLKLMKKFFLKSIIFYFLKVENWINS